MCQNLVLSLKRIIKNGDGKVSDAKQIAIRELDLMHEAIEKGDLKNVLFHKKLASMAIDEMMIINKMIDNLISTSITDLLFCIEGSNPAA